MIYKHNKRNWKYRVLAMTAGYRFRLRVFTVPAPLFDLPTGRPDDSLIGAMSPDDDTDGAMAVYA